MFRLKMWLSLKYIFTENMSLELFFHSYFTHLNSSFSPRMAWQSNLFLIALYNLIKIIWNDILHFIWNAISKNKFYMSFSMLLPIFLGNSWHLPKIVLWSPWFLKALYNLIHTIWNDILKLIWKIYNNKFYMSFSSFLFTIFHKNC